MGENKSEFARKKEGWDLEEFFPVLKPVDQVDGDVPDGQRDIGEFEEKEKR
jgi:hypothetical protein